MFWKFGHTKGDHDNPVGIRINLKQYSGKKADDFYFAQTQNSSSMGEKVSCAILAVLAKEK